METKMKSRNILSIIVSLLLLIGILILLVLISGCSKKSLIKEPSTIEISKNITTIEINEEDYNLDVIDIGIIEKLKTEKEVEVIITLKDKNKEIQSAIISELSQDEFRLIKSSFYGDWIHGQISKKGMDKLKEDSRISNIHLPIYGGTENL